VIPFPYLPQIIAQPSAPSSAFVVDLEFPGADASTTFTDNVAARTWTTFGNAQVDTSLGDQRGLFDGAGDYATTPDAAAIRFGTGDFKISFVMRYSSTAGFQTICAKGYTSNLNGSWLLQTANGNGRLIFYSTTSSTATAVCTESAGTINTGQDYLIEIERIGTTVTMKRDGVTIGSGTSAVNFDNTGVLSMGGGSSTGFNNFWFNGWIKNYEIST
jgi:hypothetical protein